MLAALPLLAMIWGARPSDIADFWMLLREGVTFGGIRLSATVVLTLIVVFALGIGADPAAADGAARHRAAAHPARRRRHATPCWPASATSASRSPALAAVAAAGLDLSSLAIVAGALSVGIGFGLQNIVSNFVSGIILLVERPVKEGDWIEVGGFSGYVRGINVRSTEIETFDRASVILPNSDLIAGTVLNRTHTGMSGRLQVPVSVDLRRRPEAGRGDPARRSPRAIRWCCEEPAPRVLFMELGPGLDELRAALLAARRELLALGALGHELRDRRALPAARASASQFYGRDLPPAAPPEPLAVTLQRAKKERDAALTSGRRFAIYAAPAGPAAARGTL